VALYIAHLASEEVEQPDDPAEETLSPAQFEATHALDGPEEEPV
jgi:hypothetical protein